MNGENDSVEIHKDNLNDNLEELIHEDNILHFDANCVRKKSNISKSSNVYKFDNPEFKPDILLNDMKTNSPKLLALLNKIEELDKSDFKKHGKLFKHFIFSDLKSNSAGVKLIASAMLAKGFHLGYKSDPVDENSNSKKKFKKIEFLTDNELAKTEKNFYLLTSVGLYDQNITVAMKKHILNTFNQRPDNINGELVRFIVMDSGFKEGIDLFDVKYIHIFEPSIVNSDQKQVIGRGTRTCGQKGLEFQPNRGWPLHVYIYDLSIPEKLQGSMMDTKTTIELYLKAMNLDFRLMNFSYDLEKTSVLGSVDYDLNKNIHSFSIASYQDNEEDLPDNGQYVYGGQHKKYKLKIVDKLTNREHIDENIVLPNGTVIGQPIQDRMNYNDLKKHIREHYSQFTWDHVKLENLCEDKTGGASGQIIQYTPTQDFIRHYFTPQNPLKGMLLWHSVGTGKCHAIDTPILMYDGSIKMVQDIMIGDYLMGDDSTPRKVLSLASGKDDLYDIIPVKGDKYTVNSEHILCLKPTNLGIKYDKNNKTNPYTACYINKNGKNCYKKFDKREHAQLFVDELQKDNIIEIPVNEYLKLPKGIKNNIKGYRVSVNFPYKEVLFDPYIIGFWLGDGSKRDPVISTQDSKVLHYLFKELPKYNLSLNFQSGYDYRISGIKKGDNKILKALQYYNLINNKHIPNDYKINDKNIRLQILAGLIDSDGYSDNKGYDIIQKNKILAEDIVFLCRSLGFSANMKPCNKSCMYKGEKKTGLYYRISISGNEVINIPVKIERKKVEERLQKKNVLVTGITVNHIGQGDYYGFTLDGNNRYLLGDFTVTHNTCSAIAAATSTFEKQGYTILWVTRTTLKSDIWKNMFDQVCNEDIREKIQNSSLTIPEEQKNKMKLLSKSWRIRAISYKQFSNLVSKQNAYYKTLVKINGEIDPLRKTLLIIDEAHKLYGGGDLSTIERPDMNALHQALMNSYQISGANSVKLLLMTATPITQNPLELIQLINLCKLSEEQMPIEFDEFSNKYLDENGEFTEKGREHYLDDIAGYISYLNREKDARQFAQPIIHNIHIPMIENQEEVEKFDKRYVRKYLDSDIGDLKKKIEEKTIELGGEVDEIDTHSFDNLYEKCDGLSEKQKTKCEKVVRSHIRELVNEAKKEVTAIKEYIKELREQMKNKNLLKKTSMEEIDENTEKYAQEYEEFKNSLYYNIKYNCGKTIKSNSKLREEIKEHPKIIKYDKKLVQLNNNIRELQSSLKNTMENYKNRIKQIRLLLKMDLNPLEKSVVRMTIKDEQKTVRNLIKIKEKENNEAIDQIKISIKKTEKRREKRYKNVRKTIRKMIDNDKREQKETRKMEMKLRKSLRKAGEYNEEFKDETIIGLVNKYSEVIDEDLKQLDKDEIEKEEMKERKKQEKQEKQAALEVKKAEKETAKIERKTLKLREREEKRATKKAQQHLKKQEKEAAKLMKKTRKTMKKRE